MKDKYGEWNNALVCLNKFYAHTKDVPNRNLESYIDFYTMMKIKSE